MDQGGKKGIFKQVRFPEYIYHPRRCERYAPTTQEFKPRKRRRKILNRRFNSEERIKQFQNYDDISRQFYNFLLENN